MDLYRLRRPMEVSISIQRAKPLRSSLFFTCVHRLYSLILSTFLLFLLPRHQHPLFTRYSCLIRQRTATDDIIARWAHFSSHRSTVHRSTAHRSTAHRSTVHLRRRSACPVKLLSTSPAHPSSCQKSPCAVHTPHRRSMQQIPSATPSASR